MHFILFDIECVEPTNIHIAWVAINIVSPILYPANAMKL